MGYNTFFEGAIKITPAVDDILLININMWLSMRHHKALEQPNYQAILTKKAWEPDGPSIMDPEQAIHDFQTRFPKFKTLSDAAISANMWIDPQPDNTVVCESNNPMDYNYPGYPYISLWSDLKLYPQTDCTYLAWDDSEKAYEMDKWFGFMVSILSSMGYTCNGVVHAQGEEYEDKWTIHVNDNDIAIQTGFYGEPTHVKELQDIRNIIQNENLYNT